MSPENQQLPSSPPAPTPDFCEVWWEAEWWTGQEWRRLPRTESQSPLNALDAARAQTIPGEKFRIMKHDDRTREVMRETRSARIGRGNVASELATPEPAAPVGSLAVASGADLLTRLYNHRAGMAPHQKERHTGKLLLEAITEIERLREINADMHKTVAGYLDGAGAEWEHWQHYHADILRG